MYFFAAQNIDHHHTFKYHQFMNWETLNSEILFKNEFLSIKGDKCKKTDGTTVEKYYSIERPDAAVIAAFTEKMELVILRQYRHPVNSTDLEIPAGFAEKFDDDILATAKRELLEESGYASEEFTKLGEAYASAGLLTNKIHFFIALNAKKIQEIQLDQNEEIEVFTRPWEEAQKLLNAGEFKDMGSATCLLLAEKHLSNR
jgi:8-oxo-dGTP pyrophosphatase MutT (NUDIX family)